MTPDSWIPGAKRIVYAVLCWLGRSPLVWRALAIPFRRWPVLSNFVPVAVRHGSVTHVLMRDDTFLNTAHKPNLVAGDFLIGMPSNERYEQDALRFRRLIPSPAQAAERSEAESARRIGLLEELQEFDLVTDYLMWITLRAVLPMYGSQTAIDAVIRGADTARQIDYMLEVRHVAAQLFSGTLAPDDVRARADAAAISLQRRMREAWPLLEPLFCPMNTEQRESSIRCLVGFAWVSHPVTVQTAALMILELLERPVLYESLRQKVAAAPSESAIRTLLLPYVLELLRFRPVFPAIGRDVIRDCSFDAGLGQYPKCKSGSAVTALVIGALFDPYRFANPGLFDIDRRPVSTTGRPTGCPTEDDKRMMFGFGPRRCPGRDPAIEVLVTALLGILRLRPLRIGRTSRDGPLIDALVVHH